MNLRLSATAAIVGAALSFSSVAFADVSTSAIKGSTTAAKTVVGTDVDTGLTTFDLTSGDYSITYGGYSNSLKSTAAGATWSVVATLYETIGGAWTAVPGSALTLNFAQSAYVATTPTVGTINANAAGTVLHLGAGTYEIKYDFSTTATGVKLTNVGTSITAVPGPIAGAGLPALLGLLGFAGYRRSKKNA